MSVFLFSPFLPLMGVLVGSGIAFFSSWFFFGRRTSADRLRTAALVANDLDVFALECSEYISDNQLHSDSNGAAGSRRLALPGFPHFNASADHRDITPTILSRLLALGVKHGLAERKIAFWWDVVADQDCCQVEADHQCGLIGSEAMKIAAELRSAVKIPEPDYASEYWDFGPDLEKMRNKALKAIAESRKDE